MLVLQPESSKGSDISDFKTTSVQVDLSQVNDIDMVEWHRHTGDMVARRLIQSTANVRKLHTLPTKLDLQLRNERTLNKIKATKVKELEDQVASTTNAKKATNNFKSLMEDKDREIKTLKAKLKIPPHELTESKELLSAYQARDALVKRTFLSKNQWQS